MNEFDKRLDEMNGYRLCSSSLDTLQVNLGFRCNQQCTHCHLMASPHRTEMMNWQTMQYVLHAADSLKNPLVDVTGGAPELNPHFTDFIKELSNRKHRVQVRTNLTALADINAEQLSQFFSHHGVQLVASLPCYLLENVRQQRDDGVYEKSIEALKILNMAGYGTDASLVLHLMHNPGSPVLPATQEALEVEYRRELNERFGVKFNNLFTLATMPVGRFLDQLNNSNQKQQYLNLLQESFNPETLETLMCRHQISIGWDGQLYDCDFNLALGKTVTQGAPSHIKKFDATKLSSRRIATGNHCFGCTAGHGSP